MFCVQKHLATALHYDFRLEHDGVLLSWAVPKGPSLNSKDKRMAVQTENHPISYGDFEGVIPSGYGAGVVMLWDRGTWEPEAESADLDAALAKGVLKFRLDGIKLKGSWALIRTRRGGEGRQQWLLIKHRDEWSGEVDVAAAAPDSVKSFGDLPSIVAASPHAHDLIRRAAQSTGKGEAVQQLREVARLAAERSSGLPSPTKPIRKAAKPSSRPLRSPVLAKPSSSKAPPQQPKFTNQTKVLYPATGFTKGDLIDYYREASNLILPHLRGRAVTLKRYPDGVDGKNFLEKRCPSHRPDWVQTARVELTDKTIDFCLINDEPTLLWAANLAAIELHVPLALVAEPDTPTARWCSTWTPARRQDWLKRRKSQYDSKACSMN